MGGAVQGSWLEDKFFFDIAINISKRCRREPTVPDLSEDRLYEVEQAVLTQRIFLSNTNSIFDPVGLLTPLTITRKVMLKEMFSKEYELKWEKELPSELKRAWVNVITNLVGLRIEFNRSIMPWRPGCLFRRQQIL